MRFDLNNSLNSGEDIRKSEFCLEMNMMKTIENMKFEAEGNGEGKSIEKKLIPETNAI